MAVVLFILTSWVLCYLNKIYFNFCSEMMFDKKLKSSQGMRSLEMFEWEEEI